MGLNFGIISVGTQSTTVSDWLNGAKAWVCFCVQEMSELRDQLRDLMFFLEAKDTLATASDATQQEIQEGRIIVQPSGSDATGTPAAANKKPRTKRR